MKLVKAFVRSYKLEEIVRALEAAEAPGITVSRVHGVGYGYAPKLFSMSEGEMEHAQEMAKVEVVCADLVLDRMVGALVAAARTGLSGDGIVFVTEVERAIRIRTGEEGPAAFRGSASGTP